MKTQVTISNPNPYKSKKTEAQMVSYRVTGSPEAIAIFIADQKAQDVDSKDDKGNPLFHVLASNASKYGVTSVIERATNANGETYWFKDNAEEKAFDVLSEVLMDDPDDESDPEGDMYNAQELTTWKKEASRRRIATTSIYMEARIVLASRTDL